VTDDDGRPLRLPEPDRGPARRPRRGPSRHAVAWQSLRVQALAARKARRQRLVLLITGFVSVMTLVVSGGAWALTGYVSSSLHRVNADTTGTPSSGPVNILVAGVDSREGLTHKQKIALHVGTADGLNSDTLMLVHIPANHSGIDVVSIPRDSWVNIPGHGMNKINAAIGFGGPALMVQTIEQVTGLTINDYVEVDFTGFVKVIDALGGVSICVPYAVDDPYSGLDISAGRHHVDGVTALEFARDRHSFALSDLSRISDQQQLLSTLFAQVTQAGVLANPVKFQEVVSSVTSAVTVDKGFNLIQLADELRGLRPQDATFTTVPVASMNYITTTGQSAVLWDVQQAQALFTWLKNDTGKEPSKKHHKKAGKAAARKRASVSVDVYNGTAIGQLSTDTGQQLTALGFTVHKAGLDWSSQAVAQTMIEYPASQLARAKLLAKVLPGAALRAGTGLARIELVLGTAGHVVTGGAKATASPSPSPSASAPAGQKTAAQDACR
jgi:LCP family protein required for cell wall assembly